MHGLGQNQPRSQGIFVDDNDNGVPGNDVGPKQRTKHKTKKLVEFHNHLHILTMV